MHMKQRDKMFTSIPEAKGFFCTKHFMVNFKEKTFFYESAVCLPECIFFSFVTAEYYLITSKYRQNAVGFGLVMKCSP